MKSISRLGQFGIACSLLFGLCSSPAHAMVQVSAVGAFTLSNYNYAVAPASASMGVGYGFGGLIGTTGIVGVELGALYLSHNTSYTVGAATVSLSSIFLDFPLMLCFSPIPFLSIGVGAYYGVALSSSTAIANDYGLAGDVSLRFPILPFVKLRVDGLYEFGLANLNAFSQNSRNIDIFAGVMFDL